MMEPMASIRRERGEARRAAQAFRDLALLLFLIMLVFSVRFQADETDPSVTPLPGGVQAADREQVEPSAVEPAAVPALAIPEPAAEPEAAPVARLQERPQRIEVQTRVLVLRGDTVHEIRLPARFTLTETESGCSEHEVEVLTRS